MSRLHACVGRAIRTGRGRAGAARRRPCARGRAGPGGAPSRGGCPARCVRAHAASPKPETLNRRDGDVKLKPKECGCSDAFVNTLNTLASKYAPGTNGTGTTAKCYAAARDMVNAELAAGAGTAVITAILRAAIDVCDDASV